MFLHSIDMNYLEEGANGPNLTVAILPKSDKIVLLEVHLYIISTIVNHN